MIDTMELVCGPNYTDQQAESVCRAGWAVDAVHPTAHTFAKMALNLMEKITPGVRGRETPRPPPPPPPAAATSSAAASTSPGRKRARSETPGPSQRTADRSTERSRNWPALREQRRAATYDVEFFNSISSSREEPRQVNQSGTAAAQTAQRGSYTPHYSFTPPQYYAPRVYLGGRGRGNRGGRGGRGGRRIKKWF
jgi:hypothetical protein